MVESVLLLPRAQSLLVFALVSRSFIVTFLVTLIISPRILNASDIHKHEPADCCKLIVQKTQQHTTKLPRSMSASSQLGRGLVWRQAAMMMRYIKLF